MVRNSQVKQLVNDYLIAERRRLREEVLGERQSTVR